tara:strand:+ start:541 stop:966 length:426 start_codon:yes stop_codon:yes gene_type:complete
MSKLTENFYLQEFVTKDLYKKWKERAYIFVDERIIYLAQYIRSRYDKPMTINNWISSSEGFNYRGWRPANCSVGSKFSQHKSGRAIDFNVSGMSPEEIYKDIMDNEAHFYDYGLRSIIKDTETYTHIDCRASFEHNTIKIL